MALIIDNVRCDGLARLGAEGNAQACRQLVEYLWPIWLEIVAVNRNMNRLVNRDDGVHDVVARLVEKIGQTEGRGLRLYVPWKERHADKQFEDWLRIVTRNTIRDYLREVGATQRKPNIEPNVKRLLNEFASTLVVDDLGVRPPFTAAQTARELLEYARARLAAQPMVVLEEWLKGSSFDEIAAEHDLSAEGARQVLRSAVAVLRRHFSASSSDDAVD